MAQIGAEKFVTEISIGEKEKLTNKGTDKQYVAVILLHNTTSLSSFLPNFRIRSRVVAEKSLTEIFFFRQTNRQTNKQTNILEKVNKQCLLEPPPPRKESVKKLGKLQFQPADLSFEKKISVESVQTKIINSFMHMLNVSTL